MTSRHRGSSQWRLMLLQMARTLLERIRGEVAEERSLEEVLAAYLPIHAKPNLVPAWLERWLEIRRRETASGTLSPGYLGELERMAAPGGHFSFFNEHSIHEITYGVLYDVLMTTLWVTEEKRHWAEKCQILWREIPDFIDMMPNGRAILAIRDPRSVLASFRAFTFVPPPAYLGAIFNCFDALKHARLKFTGLNIKTCSRGGP